MKVICLSGVARSGKDTAAEILKNTLEENGKSVLVTHYADLLKYICKTFFNWNGEKDERGRSLLQYVGTDVVRKKNPNFWVDFIVNVIKLFEKEWDFVVISDTRFPNEVTRLKEFGLDVIHVRVERTGFSSELTDEQKKHPSETAMDGFPVDVALTNTTMENYINTVRKFGLSLIQ